MLLTVGLFTILKDCSLNYWFAFSSLTPNVTEIWEGAEKRARSDSVSGFMDPYLVDHLRSDSTKPSNMMFFSIIFLSVCFNQQGLAG